MSAYQFTQDWFSDGIPIWQQIFEQMPERQRFLEIGSYEGRSTVWLLENVLADHGEVVCIDTWEGGEEHKQVGEDMSSVEQRFQHNINIALQSHPHKSVRAAKGYSSQELAKLIAAQEAPFNFIYIDGSHTAPDVLSDACLSYHLLKVGGIMIFDDYRWGGARDILHRPKMAIDSFVNIYCETMRVVHVNHQLTLEKTG